ncbi:tetratricopeptide repeat protein [Flavobacterium sp. CYK-55]|uniref:tetratricopeptide repeat-containing sensor histidine kinase n=1 Tax=Flavobacterium sp. CYK-55 TaxID=2835529 RepID=UPI001BCCBC78|nr:tetratricopeptide repeat protein [Flavobacterium sp. CYK-55]MBS7786205.1 tetratricopeptide repeat protein [Flavobacterium sp. CYK-55]
MKNEATLTNTSETSVYSMMRTPIMMLLLLTSIHLWSQNEKVVLQKKIKQHTKLDTLKCNLWAELIELEEDPAIWPKYNLELKKILLQIIADQKLQQTSPEWYVRKLFTVLMYEAQDAKWQYGNNAKAIALEFEMLKYAQSIDDAKMICQSYIEIAATYIGQKLYPEAQQYLEKALVVARKSKSESEIALVLNNLGQNYNDLLQPQKAIPLLHESLQLAQKNKLKICINIQNNLGVAYYKLKRFDLAVDHYKQSLKISQELQNTSGIIISYLNIANSLRDNKQYTNAIEYAEQALALSQKINRIPYVEAAYKMLTSLYELSHQPQKALDAFRASTILKDSIINDENKSAILKTEFKYENQKKEAQIKALAQQKKIVELESKRQKTWLYVSLFAAFVLALIGYLMFLRYKTKKQNELLKVQLEETQKTLEAEKKSVQSELKALRSQMNPHFIFNALNSIQEQFMYGDRVLANEQMGNFTTLTRQILDISRKKYISMATEVDVLTKYLELEKMRFADDFSYEITLTDEVDEDYHQIPPMLVQPLVENSIKHGLLHKSGPKKVTICFDYDEAENTLICTVEDNGIGREKALAIKESNTRTHQSFATQATEQTLELLEGEKSTLHYDDLIQAGESVGTRVTLKISLA